MKNIDFFYFFGSGYAYLPVMRIGRMAAEAGVSVRWRPFNVRTAMKENNVMLRNEVLKVQYMWRDIERRAAVDEVPFSARPSWPTDPQLLANKIGIVAAKGGWCEAYTVASFKAWYLDGFALGERRSLDLVLRPLGQDPDAVIAEAENAETDRLFTQETEAALGFGIFGSPSFVVDGEMFWGDDRLEEAILWAQDRHPLQQAGKA